MERFSTPPKWWKSPSESATAPIQRVLFAVPAAEERNEHGGTRTPDIQNRNLTLYPTELHAQVQRLKGITIFRMRTHRDDGDGLSQT